MLDKQIIARLGSHEVEDRRHELHWPDGTMQHVHPVWTCGAPDTFLRALPMSNGSFAIFDVRKLAPDLDADMRSAPARDQVGHVFFAMRKRFPNAAAMRTAALAVTLGEARAREREAA